ncbi:MAG: hypothetical protein LBT76_03580, partial [Tannerella sp.]|nr:hypothetical protein [Tannerella sp.]
HVTGQWSFLPNFHSSRNGGAVIDCDRVERGEATHPVRDGSSVENRSAIPLASRTGCYVTGQWSFLPNFHSSRNGGAANAQTTLIFNFQFSIPYEANE